MIAVILNLKMGSKSHNQCEIISTFFMHTSSILQQSLPQSLAPRLYFFIFPNAEKKDFSVFNVVLIMVINVKMPIIHI